MPRASAARSEFPCAANQCRAISIVVVGAAGMVGTTLAENATADDPAQLQRVETTEPAKSGPSPTWAQQVRRSERKLPLAAESESEETGGRTRKQEKAVRTPDSLSHSSAARGRKTQVEVVQQGPPGGVFIGHVPDPGTIPRIVTESAWHPEARIWTRISLEFIWTRMIATRDSERLRESVCWHSFSAPLESDMS